ncbi:MAG: hypothetical protein ACU837_05140 [Gammaproteobacteria bacterium]
MSNNHETNPDMHNSAVQQSVVLLPGSLLTVNRILFGLFACLMVLVVMLGFLLFPANSLLTDLEARQRTVDVNNPAHSNPALSLEVNALKGQVVALIGVAIESKLKLLEENIRADNVTAVDLGTIQEIKNDVKILRNYSDSSVNALAEHKSDIANRAAMLSTGQLLNEFLQLKYLIYFSIASCSLMIATVGGVWLHNRYRLEHHKIGRLLGKNH